MANVWLKTVHTRTSGSFARCDACMWTYRLRHGPQIALAYMAAILSGVILIHHALGFWFWTAAQDRDGRRNMAEPFLPDMGRRYSRDRDSGPGLRLDRPSLMRSI